MSLLLKYNTFYLLAEITLKLRLQSTEEYFPYIAYAFLFLPEHASEQGNVIGSVHIYVIVKARLRGNYAANSPSPRALARGQGLLQHNFRGNPLL